MADRGTRNRGRFTDYMTEKGVEMTEAPWTIGKVERRGGLVKAIVRKIVHDVPTVGQDQLVTIGLSFKKPSRSRLRR